MNLFFFFISSGTQNICLYLRLNDLKWPKFKVILIILLRLLKKLMNLCLYTRYLSLGQVGSFYKKKNFFWKLQKKNVTPPFYWPFHFQSLQYQKEDWVQWATDFLDSWDLQLACLPFDSISATASLHIGCKRFFFPLVSHTVWSLALSSQCLCGMCHGFIVLIAH